MTSVKDEQGRVAHLKATAKQAVTDSDGTGAVAQQQADKRASAPQQKRSDKLSTGVNLLESQQQRATVGTL